MLSSSLLRRCLLGVALTVTVVPAAPVQWTAASGGNDNWYEFVSAGIFQGIDFNSARTAALASSHMGLNGYLATVTSAGEQAFIKNNLPFVYGFGATSTAYLGASDLSVPGQYRWLDGPEAGQLLTYTNWGAGQPPAGGDYLVFLMNAQSVGSVFDFWIAHQPGNRAIGYIVEYGDGVVDASNAVPEPSAFVLSLAGLGALALKLRRR